MTRARAVLRAARALAVSGESARGAHQLVHVAAAEEADVQAITESPPALDARLDQQGHPGIHRFDRASLGHQQDPVGRHVGQLLEQGVDLVEVPGGAHDELELDGVKQGELIVLVQRCTGPHHIMSSEDKDTWDIINDKYYTCSELIKEVRELLEQRKARKEKEEQEMKAQEALQFE